MMIPRLTDGGTVVCLASGPSLTPEDVETVRETGFVTIAINDAVQLAPWAAVLYSSDSSWWTRAAKMPAFHGLKYKVSAQHAPRVEKTRWPGVVILENTGERGLELTPPAIRTGKNSGSAAINLAVHLGARRVLLLGYDMGPHLGRHHFFEAAAVANLSPYVMFRKYLATMAGPLAEAGIVVLNCSRRTALECFPCVTLEAALEEAPTHADRALSANV